MTEAERHLQEALHEANVCDAYQNGLVNGLQAAGVLQGIYCERVCRELATQEGKKGKKKGKGKIVNDGLPKLLTGNAFHAHTVHIITEQEQEQATLDERRQAKERQARPIADWKAAELARKVCNTAHTAAWKIKVEEWQAE